MTLGGIRDFLLIVNPDEKYAFEKLFNTAVLHLGINLQIITQAAPNGIAEAFILAKQATQYQTYDNFALILGDNLFHGATLTGSVQTAIRECNNGLATIFAQHVSDPYRFGVVSIERDTQKIRGIIEKPKTIDDTFLNYAITGMYVFPKYVVRFAEELKPSPRGELEIVDLIKEFHEDEELRVEVFKRGVSWFDTGTADSLLDAAHYVKTIQVNQGFLVGSPHEVAFRNKWVEDIDVLSYYNSIENSSYGKLLKEAFINGNY